MKNMKKFEKDLQVGQKYEKFFADTMLQGQNPQFGYDNKYDIITDLGDTYEVKTDMQVFVYYRLGFEVQSRGKLSGIWTTEARYWVIIIPIIDKIYVLEVDKIKEFIKEHGQTAIIRSGGDDKTSKMILWDLDFFIENFRFSGVENISVPLYCDKKKQRALLNSLLKYMNKSECKVRSDENDNINKHYERLLLKMAKPNKK